MNKNIMVVAIVVLAIIGSGFILFNGKTYRQPSNNISTDQNTQQNSQRTNPTEQPTAGSEQSKNTITVEYSGQGFSPNSTTVKAGTTVTWTNKDTNQLWVASDPHPVHTNYPGFDTLKGIATGETYSFTFTKVGKWGYHNHLAPDKKGEVVVEQ